MRKFSNGSVRDELGDKPRLELLPFDLFYKRLGKVLTDGAKHYGSNNYRKGQPISSSIGSLLRHLSLYMSGDTTEDHASKIVFNSLNILNADEYFKNDPLINDIQDWFKDGKPTGEGNYEEKQTKKGNST